MTVRDLIGDLTLRDAEALWDWVDNQDPSDDEAHESVGRQLDFCDRLIKAVRDPHGIKERQS